MTPKQERFCKEYIIDCNATQAAERAGYSKKTAYTIGQKLTKKSEISNYIAGLMADKDNQLIASQDEILQFLTKVMRGQEKNEYFSIETGEILEAKAQLKERIKAAELLGKRYMMWSDKVKIEVDDFEKWLEVIDDKMFENNTLEELRVIYANKRKSPSYIS